MSSVLKQTHYTAEEYLTLERSALYKNEFHDGQIHAMTGASRAHNLITVNIAGELRQNCRPVRVATDSQIIKKFLISKMLQPASSYWHGCQYPVTRM